ncbi:hypothetical protein BT96DRAFT_949840 [Gymnopus androsaceus JB14]|uniref:Uncharacterized protein n=1 Tax=Gymnopus androsaceus JB14 TaxID=1447944 RepID=A0A6A4GJE3_9AGAR|nr:hypothetical protein BT96DRAFT_949840 [Gymnopus androsaceus JB14]
MTPSISPSPHSSPAASSSPFKLPENREEAQALFIALKRRAYHFLLTDANSWDMNYNGFNYLMLYNTVVDYFDVKAGTLEAKHTRKLLAWWNKYQQSAAQAVKSSMSFWTTLAAQRAAKAKAVAAQAMIGDTGVVPRPAPVPGAT